MIRAPIDQVLVVQGGPGTGKTAVALHRAAYLLFEHRRRLARDGVLVVGPNRAFLDYIANVLPSLGERSVRQCTVARPVRAEGRDHRRRRPDDGARWKGRRRHARRARAAALRRDPAARRRRRRADRRPHASCSRATRSPSGWTRRQVGRRPGQPAARAVAGARPAGAAPAHRPRRRLVRRPARCARRSINGVADAAADPARRPAAARRRPGRRRAWTAADQLLVDEANSMLNGPPFTYGHVVVDEAQDHSAVALRVIGRRSRRSGSMTIVGDVAQSTTPAGQERWADVFAPPSGADGRYGRRADDRLPRARADPRRRQPAAAAHRRRRQRQPQRARRGRAAGVDARRRRASSPATVASVVAERQAPPPPHRRRRRRSSCTTRSPRRWPAPGCRPSTTSTSSATTTCRCSGPSR